MAGCHIIYKVFEAESDLGMYEIRRKPYAGSALSELYSQLEA